MDRLSKTARALRHVARIAVVIALAVSIYFALRGVSPEGVLRVLRRANVELLLLAVPVLLTANFAFRTGRFASVLGKPAPPTKPASHRSIFAAVLLSNAANNVLPLRAGELARTKYFLSRGYALTDVALAQLIEKLVELAALLVWAVPVVATTFSNRKPVWIAAGVLVVGMPLAVWFVRRLHAARMRKPIHVFDLLRAWAFSLGSDSSDILLIWVCLHALGIPGGLRTCVIVYVGVNLAIAVPSTPGQLGPLEAGATLSLVALGVQQEAALGFALLYRIVQWVPVTSAGFVVWLYRTLQRRARARHASPPETPQSDRQVSPR